MASDDKKTVPIFAANWNALRVYSFEIGKISEDGTIEVITKQPNPATDLFVGPPSLPTEEKKDFLGKVTSMILRLPPQSLSIQTQFANSVIATNKGILEENSGIVFRTISISGTTGVWPDRPQAVEPPSGPMKAVGAFFPGTMAKWNNLRKAVNRTAGAATQLVSQAKGLFGNAKDTDQTEKTVMYGNLTPTQKKETGYYQFWELYNWFIDYAEFKKTSDGKKHCLIFNDAKDNISFAVTPISFDLRRDSSRPLLYNYSIVLKAWRVLKSSDLIKGRYNKGQDIRNPSFIKQILETIRRGRQTIQAFEGLLSGFQSDIGDVIDIAAQVHMLAKDAVGATATVFDMPKLIRNNAVAIWQYNGSQMRGALARLDNSQKWSQGQRKQALNFATLGGNPDIKNFYDTVGAVGQLAVKVAQISRDLVLSSKKGGSQESDIGNSAKNPSALDQAVSEQANSSNTSVDSGESNSTNDKNSAVITQAVNDLLKNSKVADDLAIDSLNFPPEIEKQIQEIFDKAGNLNSGDVILLAGKLQKLCNSVTKNGTGSLTHDQIIMMADIQDMTNAMICLTVSQDIFSNNKQPDTYTDENNILSDEHKMQIPSSYYPVTVGVGDTIPSIADKYLGDQKKHTEIVALNRLREPYIDHQGFNLSIGKCTKSTFTVKSTDKIAIYTSLSIGQKITLSGPGQAASRRVIKNINWLNTEKTEAIITVSSPENLLLDTVGTNIIPRYNNVFSRPPGTLGFGDTVLIPTQLPGNMPDNLRVTPRSDALSYAEKLFMIDIKIDEKGDLKVSPSGDLDMATGYHNAVQALRSAVETEKNELKNHKDFGIPDIIGRRNSTISNDAIREVIRNRVLADPRFEDARVFINTQGSIVNIRIEAFGANGTGLIPIEFQFTA